MQIGLVGAGNMAGALARGWGDPVLCTDAGSGRAAALAAEVGGEALGSNAELAARADLVVLGHKPAQLDAVAAEVAPAGTPVVSLLARTPLAELRRAYPGVPVFRVEPNVPVAVGRGVCALAVDGEPVDAALAERVRALFARVGAVVAVPEPLMGVAGGCSGVGPAYFALLVEAQVDAAVRHGMPAAQASVLVAETMAGTAELLRERAYDTLALRRSVASPGGTTARGLAELERGGVRAAFGAALDSVVAG
jgi:pyrroline-5-carboxylate reductase